MTAHTTVAQRRVVHLPPAITRHPFHGQIHIFRDPLEYTAGVATGSDGAMWFSDPRDSAIGRLTTKDKVTLYTGSGIVLPESITAGPDGALWFVDRGAGSIGRITTAGVVTLFPDSHVGSLEDITTGPDGALWFTTGDGIERVTTGGSFSFYPFQRTNTFIVTTAISTGPDGNLWFTAYSSSRRHPGAMMGSITTAGVYSNEYILSDKIKSPNSIVSGPDGNLWINGVTRGRIAEITPGGVVTLHRGISVATVRGLTVLGGKIWFAASDGVHSWAGSFDPATGHARQYPDASGPSTDVVTVGPDGNLWITGSGLTRVTPHGAATTFHGPSYGINAPTDIVAGPDGAMWFLNGPAPGAADPNSRTVGRITANGTVTLYSDPSIVFPRGLVVGPDGALWFTEQHGVGQITTAGIVTSYTGAGIKYPSGITAGPDGALWIADGQANEIVRVTTTGGFTAFAEPYAATTAIVTGPDGALWFGSTRHSISRMTTAGDLTTFTDRQVKGPEGILWGPDGNLWYTDAEDNEVGRMTPDGVFKTLRPSGIGGASAMIVGPDGVVWYAGRTTTPTSQAALGRINVRDKVSVHPVPGSVLGGIATGPDGNIWFTVGGFGSDEIGWYHP